MRCQLVTKRSTAAVEILAAPATTTTTRESARSKMDNAEWIVGEFIHKLIVSNLPGSQRGGGVGKGLIVLDLVLGPTAYLTLFPCTS